MSSYQVKAMDKITYSEECTASYSGQTNMTALVYVNNEPVGGVDYVLYGNELTVSDIIVKPEWRRKGFGSRLMYYIRLKNPEYKYVPSMKTDLGSKFKAKKVHESLGDVLRPKQGKEISDALQILQDAKEAIKINMGSKKATTALKTTEGPWALPNCW